MLARRIHFKELSVMKDALEERKSSLNHDQEYLSKKWEIMHKWYKNVVLEYESNHSRMKFLEENFKTHESN